MNQRTARVVEAANRTSPAGWDFDEQIIPAKLRTIMERQKQMNEKKMMFKKKKAKKKKMYVQKLEEEEDDDDDDDEEQQEKEYQMLASAGALPGQHDAKLNVGQHGQRSKAPKTARVAQVSSKTPVRSPAVQKEKFGKRADREELRGGKRMDRKEKERERKLFTDKVAFGEVVQGPPMLTAQPRRSQKTKPGNRALLLRQLTGGTVKQTHRSAAPAPSMARQSILLAERTRVMKAYRDLKVQRLSQKEKSSLEGKGRRGNKGRKR
uniref:Uncharacterized protein n=1 Tax=Eptatretus burgeri TaxID=7764 RepID=A0A8C4NG28_EPTBU